MEIDTYDNEKEVRLRLYSCEYGYASGGFSLDNQREEIKRKTYGENIEIIEWFADMANLTKV